VWACFNGTQRAADADFISVRAAPLRGRHQRAVPAAQRAVRGVLSPHTRTGTSELHAETHVLIKLIRGFRDPVPPTEETLPVKLG
jgi:hypothetical protein